jgi:hypothetical protein
MNISAFPLLDFIPHLKIHCDQSAHIVRSQALGPLVWISAGMFSLSRNLAPSATPIAPSWRDILSVTATNPWDLSAFSPVLGNLP